MVRSEVVKSQVLAYRRFADSFREDSNDRPRCGLYLAAIVPYNGETNFPRAMREKIVKFAAASENNAVKVAEWRDAAYEAGFPVPGPPGEPDVRGIDEWKQVLAISITKLNTDKKGHNPHASGKRALNKANKAKTTETETTKASETTGNLTKAKKAGNATKASKMSKSTGNLTKVSKDKVTKNTGRVGSMAQDRSAFIMTYPSPPGLTMTREPSAVSAFTTAPNAYYTNIYGCIPYQSVVNPSREPLYQRVQEAYSPLRRDDQSEEDHFRELAANNAGNANNAESTSDI
ncbi:hypothetical protein SODALDRAFT_325951 [Sodiomyces alkalinus F11]|uniref:Uncharacterized protein n=1 Tax=Sodiomyces alkalinus (strain CBS 110278 / VKM F-3762 / F11) TaxID=1314773 RepID=A0A3N2PQ61_SODAK|nr:hypothetical protein SODALDRAFT_325951 [Sodiomyces alkalinus F11]ROT36649.1 hypothetical protein SODALDRAFT_325951 [Sodiomyces alkalinus F11]